MVFDNFPSSHAQLKRMVLLDHILSHGLTSYRSLKLKRIALHYWNIFKIQTLFACEIIFSARKPSTPYLPWTIENKFRLIFKRIAVDWSNIRYRGQNKTIYDVIHSRDSTNTQFELNKRCSFEFGWKVRQLFDIVLTRAFYLCRNMILYWLYGC